MDEEEVINGFKVEEGILEVEDIVKRDEDDVKLEVMIIELEDSVNEDREFWVEKLREDDGFNICLFNDNILEFMEIFDFDCYKIVDEDYLVEDLIGVVV